MTVPNIYEFEGFRLDAEKRHLLGKDGERIQIPSKAFETLLFLIQHRGAVVEKGELLKSLWADTFVEENNLSQHISTLRKVFGEHPNDNRFIATVSGRGYKFVAEVREVGGIQVSYDQARDAISQDLDVKGYTAAHSKKSQGFLTIGLVVMVIVAVAAVGTYLWRRNSLRALSNRSIKTLAVLPFKPLVIENKNDELELGMADTLISKLSSSDVTVRPLSTVRRFNSLDQDPLAAGQELGVEAVLDGTVQTAEDRIRVSARLIRTSDGRQLWAGQFDESFTDIFSVQDSITARVASVLKATLEKRPSAYTQNVNAYQLFIKGRYHLLKITRPETDKAIEYFQLAIAIDPSYASAYVGLADSYRLLTLSGEMPPDQFLPKAKAAAQKAIEIDRTLADAYWVLGSITFWYDWDWQKAESYFRQALELDPKNAEAHIFYANLLSNVGRHSEALAEAEKAVELDPLNLRTSALEAQFLLHAGKAEEAIRKLQSTIDMDQNFWLAHLYAASAYIEKQMYPEAIEEARKARSLYESARSSSFLAFALARSGKTKEALDELNGSLTLSRKQYVSPYNIAMIYNGLGEREQALTWLERGIQARDPRMTFLKVEPKWNNLRKEQPFIKLMQQMAL